VGHLLAQCRRSLSHFPSFKKYLKQRVDVVLDDSEKVVNGILVTRNSSLVSREIMHEGRSSGASPATFFGKSTCPILKHPSLLNNYLEASLEVKCKSLVSKEEHIFFVFPPLCPQRRPCPL
jgi:hypothetical protein